MASRVSKSKPFARVSVRHAAQGQKGPAMRVVMTVNSKFGSKLDFTNMLRNFEMLFERKKRFTLIVDAGALEGVDLGSAGVVMRHMKTMQPFAERYLIATAVILRSKVVGTILNGVFKIQTPTRPHKMVYTRAEADAYLETAKL
jgi:hypothetical protein